MLAANRNAAKANLESRIHERELTNKREVLQRIIDAKQKASQAKLDSRREGGYAN